MISRLESLVIIGKSVFTYHYFIWHPFRSSFSGRLVPDFSNQFAVFPNSEPLARLSQNRIWCFNCQEILHSFSGFLIDLNNFCLFNIRTMGWDIFLPMHAAPVTLKRDSLPFTHSDSPPYTVLHKITTRGNPISMFYFGYLSLTASQESADLGNPVKSIAESCDSFTNW
jgi:hypothetical protein